MEQHREEGKIDIKVRSTIVSELPLLRIVTSSDSFVPFTSMMRSKRETTGSMNLLQVSATTNSRLRPVT
jgi:hypothetical protein